MAPSISEPPGTSWQWVSKECVRVLGRIALWAPWGQIRGVGHAVAAITQREQGGCGRISLSRARLTRPLFATAPQYSDTLLRACRKTTKKRKSVLHGEAPRSAAACRRLSDSGCADLRQGGPRAAASCRTPRVPAVQTRSHGLWKRAGFPSSPNSCTMENSLRHHRGLSTIALIPDSA